MYLFVHRRIVFHDLYARVVLDVGDGPSYGRSLGLCEVSFDDVRDDPIGPVEPGTVVDVPGTVVVSVKDGVLELYRRGPEMNAR